MTGRMFEPSRLAKKVRFILLVVFVLSSATSRAATYYIDNQTGDDAQPGTSPVQAWKSLDRVNRAVFKPGDQVLFEAGSRYAGQFAPQGSGRPDAPILLGRHGQGPNPRFDGEGQVLDTLLLRNVEYWDVQDLEITNQGENRAPSRTGVHVCADGYGPMHHIHLRRLYVHDVNSDLSKQREGCGIFFDNRGRNQSRFDDLIIEDCHLVRTDRNGICQRNGARTHSVGVIIRRNLLEDIGGDGIKTWGSDAPLVEYNVLRGGRMRCADEAAGIWPFDCDDALIQFNEVSGMKGAKDGEGYDSDYLCHRSIFQYNYSHDNEGGFMLICTPGNSFNRDTIIRYNISQNDGLETSRVFHFGGGAQDTLVYNNTIYIGPRQKLPLLMFTTWNRGDADHTHFFNTIFYVDGEVSYQWGQSTNSFFADNVFYGRHSLLPDGAGAITNRPPLLKPGSGGNGFDSLTGYQLGARFRSGRIVPHNGGRDFFGRPVPQNTPPSLGAAQLAK